eukprot:EC724128.1.p3 GENE.EC724128.1~~EC724128.1.p3  ORF type:complete len:78 (-),score=3.31 EC724128.1:79-312(-)
MRSGNLFLNKIYYRMLLLTFETAYAYNKLRCKPYLTAFFGPSGIFARRLKQSSHSRELAQTDGSNRESDDPNGMLTV